MDQRQLSTALAVAVSLVLAAMPAGASPCQISFGTMLMAPPTNPNFHPLPLAAGAALRGLSLSGKGCMSQTDGAGHARWHNRRFAWKERYKLETGCTMLNAVEPVVVDAGPGTAFIAAGTSAVVHTEGRASRYVNLTDRHRNSMRVVFGKHFVDLDPGFEVVLVKGDHLDAKAIAIQENIGWREMRQLDTENMLVFVYRISAADMMRKCKIYAQLSESPLEADRRLREELLKSVAALETMYNKKKGPYKLDEPFKYGPVERQTAEVAGSS